MESFKAAFVFGGLSEKEGVKNYPIRIGDFKSYDIPVVFRKG